MNKTKRLMNVAEIARPLSLGLYSTPAMRDMARRQRFEYVQEMLHGLRKLSSETGSMPAQWALALATEIAAAADPADELDDDVLEVGDVH